ncbi:MAG: hypothetical protein AABO57_23590 [Acidobacteriota bacterium]
MTNDQQISSYVLCINDGGYPESLEVRKVYAVLPDERAAANNYIRVIDETGEDYLYPKKYFVSIELPPEVAKDLPRETTTRSPQTR